MAALLEVRNLQKRYGAVIVAEDLNFSIDNRCCIGLIGPNGAGKSSLFDMLTGIVDADGGQIRFEDRDICGWRLMCGREWELYGRSKFRARSPN